MRIAIGSDHRGYKVKEKIKSFLNKNSYEIIDVGCYSEESCDYPDFGFAVAEKVSQLKVDRGILICSSGVGMCIAANKVKGVRAALCLNSIMGARCIEHNDANVLCLASDFTGYDEIELIIKEWLTKKFLGDRHQKRLDKIKKYEDSLCGGN